MKPLAPISNSARLALGILFFILFFAAWAFATLGGYVSKTFLADPLTMVEEGWLLLTKHGFSSTSPLPSGAYSAVLSWRRWLRSRSAS